MTNIKNYLASIFIEKNPFKIVLESIYTEYNDAEDLYARCQLIKRNIT